MYIRFRFVLLVLSFTGVTTSADAGIFGPSNAHECVLEKMKGQDRAMIGTARAACAEQFPEERPVVAAQLAASLLPRQQADGPIRHRADHRCRQSVSERAGQLLRQRLSGRMDRSDCRDISSQRQKKNKRHWPRSQRLPVRKKATKIFCGPCSIPASSSSITERTLRYQCS